MKKRIFAVLLLSVLLMMAADPTLAIVVRPNASSDVDGGLVYVGGTTHILWASGMGVVEYKTVTASLAKYSAGVWYPIDSVQNSGTTATVDASKNTTISSSGSYRVIATCTTSSGTSTRTRYYTI